MPAAKKTTAKAAKAPVAETAAPAVETVKKPRAPKKTAAKAAAVKTLLQFNGNEFDISALSEKVTKAANAPAGAEIVIYVKPEEGAAYYTVNGEGSDAFKVEL